MGSVPLNRPELVVRRQVWLLACVCPSVFLLVVMLVLTEQLKAQMQSQASRHNAQLQAQAATFSAQLAEITATHHGHLTRMAEDCNAQLDARAAEFEKRK